MKKAYKAAYATEDLKGKQHGLGKLLKECIYSKNIGKFASKALITNERGETFVMREPKRALFTGA
jgi:hypothetical protein